MTKHSDKWITLEQPASKDKWVTISEPIKPQPTAAKAPVVNKPVVKQPIVKPAVQVQPSQYQGYIKLPSSVTDWVEKQEAKRAESAKKNLVKRAEWEKKHPFISDIQKSVIPNYTAKANDWELEAKYGDKLNAPYEEQVDNYYKNVRSNIAPTVNIATMRAGIPVLTNSAKAGIAVASKAKPIAEFVAKHPFIANTIAGAPAAAVEGAAFGVLDKGLSDLSGIETDYDYADAAKIGALIGPAAHGGINTALATGKVLSKTKPIQAISKAHNDLLNSDTALGNTIANIEGTISNALNLGSKNETVNKYKALDEAIARGNVPMNKQLTPEELELIKMEQNLTDEQAWQLKHMLDNGVNSPENVADDLSHVKSETDNLTPKTEEPHVKTQPDMSGEVSEKPLLDNFQTEEQFEQLPKQPKQKVVEDNGYVIPKQEQTVPENNYFKKTKSPSTQEALANYEKNTGKKVSTIEPEEVIKLPAGKAEGSDWDNTLRVKSKAKRIGSDDLIENEDVINEFNEGLSTKLDKDGKPLKAQDKYRTDEQVEVENISKGVETQAANDLLPDDIDSLQKEIAEYQANNKKLPRIKENKAIAEKIVNSELGVAGINNTVKSTKLTNILKTPKMEKKVQRCLQRLFALKQSREVEKVINRIYSNASDTHRKFIEELNNGKYTLDARRVLKSGKSIKDEYVSPKVQGIDATPSPRGFGSEEYARIVYENNPNFKPNVKFANKASGKLVELPKADKYDEWGNIKKPSGEDLANYSISDTFNPHIRKLRAENKSVFKKIDSFIRKCKSRKIKGDKAKQIFENVFSPEERRLFSEYNGLKRGEIKYDAKSVKNYLTGKGDVSELTPKHSIRTSIGNLCKLDTKYKRAFKGFEDIEVCIQVPKEGEEYFNGIYIPSKNIIKINPLVKDPEAILFHEIQHRIQKIIEDITQNPRLLALEKSRARRTQEYLDFLKIEKNNNVMRKVAWGEPLSKEELPIAKIGKKLRTRYEQCFKEKEAHKAQYAKLLFRKDKISEKDWRQILSRRTRPSASQRSLGIVRETTNRRKNESLLREPRVSRRLVQRNSRESWDKGLNNYSINQPSAEISPEVQQIYDYYKKLSPETEKLKIERGAITEEQAKNRLKQQGDGSGNGLYYKDYSEPTGEAEFIEWTKDYNERRDSKVGEFGIKEKDGTKKANLKGTIKDALQEKHTKFALDLVDKHFAKPIENGKVQPGYVGVNRALLGTAIGRKYGTSWYETMLKGGDAIDKAFNETQAKGWKEYAERNNKLDYQIPKQVFDKLFDGSGETVAEYWSRYGKTHTHKAIAKTAGALLDAYNNSFKRGVLTSLSFWANNRMGNQIMLAAKSNPIEHARSVFEAFKMKDSSVPVELVESSLLEAMNDFRARKTYTGWNAFDNMLNLFGGHEIKTETLKKMVQPPKPLGVKNYVKMNGETVLEGTELKGTWKSGVAEVGNKCIALPNKVFDKVCDRLMKFNEVFERFERKQAFAIQVNKAKKQIMKSTGQKMITTEEAIKHLEAHPEMMEIVIKNVEDVLGDYNKFNNTEKKIFKRIVPFYSWYRTITRHTLNLAKENPTRFAMIALEMQRINERGEDRKEWQKGAFDTRLFDKRTGRKILSNKTAQIPYNTFKELFEENAKGSISPAITKPIEAARGKKFFNDSEITSRRYKRVSKYNVNSKKYEADGYLDKKTGKKVKDLPLSTKVGYLGKEALQTAYPILRSPFVKAESLIQGVGKAVKDGNFLEPDAMYDADFGGYYHNEHFYGKEKRYASGQMDQGFKIANRFGLSLQTQRPLNKQERAELNKKRKEKNKRFIDRFKNNS